MPFHGNRWEVEFNYLHAELALEAVKRYEIKLKHPAERRFYMRISLILDLLAADGRNGNAPLDWSALLSYPDFDFFHDVAGIHRHMNRDTGELMNCFVPRCARVN
jgi:hypothetical protein